MGRIAELPFQPFVLQVHEAGNGFDRVIEPRRQGLVFGDAYDRLLVIVAVGFDEGRQQHARSIGMSLPLAFGAHDVQLGTVSFTQALADRRRVFFRLP